MAKKKPMAFEFVLDELYPIVPSVRPMFGCHALYVGDKIVLITRSKAEHPDDNGVWIVTTPDHHESLRHEFPSMRRIKLLGNKETSWQNLPAESADFEESVLKACALIKKGDHRIGKTPLKKKSDRLSLR